MPLKIRPTTQKDFRATETLTRDAFWDIYKPGCEEHLVLHNLRKSPAYIKSLDLVAEDNGKIIGHIIYTKARITDNENEHEILTMGPVSVLPEHQKKGIGKELIEHSIKKAKDLGYKGVIIFGNPTYYQRFGFREAKTYSITTKTGESFDAFMALELNPPLPKGRFYEDKAFETDKEELEDFEKNFPKREKHKTPTQLFSE